MNHSKDRLGKGGQGMVYRVYIQGQEDQFVDKMSYPFYDRNEAFRMINQAYNEFQIAKSITHPNIVMYKCFVHTFNAAKNKYQSHTIMEMLEGGDMVSYFKNRSITDAKDILNTARLLGSQLIEALKFLYRNKIIHRDIKPANIVFNKDHSIVKLIDLGLSMKYQNAQNIHQRVQEDEGTYRYMSPE
jgi:serine/threonine protein kinase